MNIIKSQEYYNELMKINETTKPPNQEKQKILVSKVMSRWCDDNDAIKEKITRAVEDICQLRVGRKLLKKLPSDLWITKGRKWECLVQNEVTVKEINDSVYNIVWHREKNKTYSEKLEDSLSTSVLLFHELCHVVHSDRTAVVNNIQNLINQHISNEEEQRTITGLTCGEHGYQLTSPICENAFRIALGLPLRVAHRGFLVSDNNLNNWIEIDAMCREISGDGKTINMKKKIMQYKESINAVLPALNRLPISYAIQLGQEYIVNELIAQGARLDLDDTFGGVFGAIFHREVPIEFVEKLFKEILVRDPVSLYEKFLSSVTTTVQSGYIEASAPFLRAVVDEEKKGLITGTVAKALGAPWGYKIASMLLEYGADVHQTDDVGNTPLMVILCKCVAKKIGMVCGGLHRENQRMFLSLIDTPLIDLDHTKQNGSSALSLAVRLEDVSTISALLERGARVPQELAEKITVLMTHASSNSSPLEAWMCDDIYGVNY